MTAKEFDYVLSFLDTIIRVENNVDIEDEPNENCCKNVSVLLKMVLRFVVFGIT